MTTGIAILLLVLVTWTVAGLFYDYVIRPVLRDRIRFRLFAIRDELRRLAIDQKIEARSTNYRFMERMLCRAINKCEWFTWQHFGEYIVSAGEVPKDIVVFEESATNELKEIRDRSVLELLVIMDVNSPGMAFLMRLITLCCKDVEPKAKVFVQEPPEIIEMPAQTLLPSAA